MIDAGRVARLPVKLQNELHGSWIGRDVRNQPERTSCLMHAICGSVRIRWQTEIRVGQSQVLMVQGVEYFPPKLEVALF